MLKTGPCILYGETNRKLGEDKYECDSFYADRLQELMDSGDSKEANELFNRIIETIEKGE